MELNFLSRSPGVLELMKKIRPIQYGQNDVAVIILQEGEDFI